MSTGEGAEPSGEGAGTSRDGAGEGQEDVEEEVPRIHVEIPRCVANLGSDIHFVKLPNFLSVETRLVTLGVLYVLAPALYMNNYVSVLLLGRRNTM